MQLQLATQIAVSKLTVEFKMASDSSEDELENWVFYRDREEWRDVTPIEQDDGPFPVVAIAYTDKCKWSVCLHCLNPCCTLLLS